MATAPLLKNDGLAGGGPTFVLGVLHENPKNDPAGEKRVAMTPDVAKMLIGDGYTIYMEKGAGAAASFSDDAYDRVGCKMAERGQVIASSAVVFAINPPEADFGSLSGKILISWVGRLTPAGQAVVTKATEAKITLCDVTHAPRISIAQKLDVLSSQAKVAGHRAVMEAAHSFGRFHSGEMTASGKFPPSQTFVLGVGVAGLAAIGTSRALGSVVKAWDVRDVSDQVKSMGAGWVTVDFKEDASGSGGYAKESSKEFQAAQQATFKKHLESIDIAITTAAIPGKPSPVLITDDMVKVMKPGSVIVDLAAVGGGNCTMTRKDEVHTTANGVTIIGYTDLPGRMSCQSSSMYAQNMMQLLRHIHGKEKAAGFMKQFEGHLASEDGDIVTRSIVTCKGGQAIKAPPPPPMLGKTTKKVVEKFKKPDTPGKDAICNMLVLSIVFILLMQMGSGTPVSVLRPFLLAGAAGYQAVWGVAHALHTPLMSVTNAISGMTIIGGIHLFHSSSSEEPKMMAAVSAGVSAVNIVGGFIVTQRMLNLFKRKEDQDYSAVMFIPGLVLVAYAIVSSDVMNGRENVDAKMIDVNNTICSCLCIFAIVCLASQKSANIGAKFGMVGVICACFNTLLPLPNSSLMGLAPYIGAGSAFGLVVGSTISPMKLPQTVAAFHSLVGFAAMATSMAAYFDSDDADRSGANVKNISALAGNFIGGVTLTGSLIAFGKLNGNLGSKALNLPGKNFINLIGLFSFLGLSAYLCLNGDQDDGDVGRKCTWGIALIACLMGYHLVASVGGGDMPVCITVLNSYSGWALAAEGFNLNQPMLACVGSIIGFSGAILTKIMCDAMNRDIANVIFGGMNVAAPAKKGDEEKKEHVETTVSATAALLVDAKKVCIVPGYGMAQARAQNPVGALCTALRDADKVCDFIIHPVAGRMPGQMNVLLAEAGVPYDFVKEMDEVNDDMDSYDVCIVLGANDITNSAAEEVEGCAIWGMPVIKVWHCKKTIFCKRSMAGGYADLENPVFFKENTNMLLGDGLKTAEALLAELKTMMADSV
jgi:NAD(P) transhydrogenase